jgi:hypothetical protein
MKDPTECQHGKLKNIKWFVSVQVTKLQGGVGLVQYTNEEKKPVLYVRLAV